MERSSLLWAVPLSKAFFAGFTQSPVVVVVTVPDGLVRSVSSTPSGGVVAAAYADGAAIANAIMAASAENALNATLCIKTFFIICPLILVLPDLMKSVNYRIFGSDSTKLRVIGEYTMV